MLNFLSFIYRRILNNVIFGISMMMLIAAYIAVGSGLPQVREFFEMDELAFFNAWPLKLMMLLLVASLVTVTFTRIPLTPPRYGVWCVHFGIIILIFGMAAHYWMKVEGLALVHVGRSADHYYDRFERSLNVRVGGVQLTGRPLPSLPRFREYAPELGNVRRLDRRDLRDIEFYVHASDPHTGRRRVGRLSEELGLSDDLKFDIVGYYPYAEIVIEYVEDPGVDNVGLRMTGTDPMTGRTIDGWLVSSDESARREVVGDAELEHRHVALDTTLEAIRASARRVHRLDITAGEHQETMHVVVGERYELGDSGYTIEVEDYIPAFPMFGSGELAKVLTLMVSGPGQQFRRQVLADHPDRQTDFRLDVPDAGPFGQRQTALLDEQLRIVYRFNDPHGLLPSREREKHTFVTAGDELGILHVLARTDAAIQVRQLDGPEASVEVSAVPADVAARHPTPLPRTTLTVRRVDTLRRIERVETVPTEQRTRQFGELGLFQVALVRVRSGEWSQTIAVPFTQYARLSPWEGGIVRVPGTPVELQLQLGNTVRGLPARVTLEKFELVHYDGGDVNVGIPRDFRSTLLIEEQEERLSLFRRPGGQVLESGEGIRIRRDVAHMNSPVYVNGGQYLYFQAAWDPEGQRWTILGVGNRPAVNIMVGGSIMIFAGLLYAFYVKPIIIRRMKQQALERAQALGVNPLRRRAAAPAGRT